MVVTNLMPNESGSVLGGYRAALHLATAFYKIHF